MRILILAALLLALFAAGAIAAAIAIRVAPSDPTRWHADPTNVPGTGKSNDFRTIPEGFDAPDEDMVSPVFIASSTELAEAFDAMALAQPRTERVAGEPADFWITYVQRSRVFQFPDYISVWVVDLGDGRSSLAVYSRARYGWSDFGVNAARVRAWLDALPLPHARDP